MLGQQIHNVIAGVPRIAPVNFVCREIEGTDLSNGAKNYSEMKSLGIKKNINKSRYLRLDKHLGQLYNLSPFHQGK